jgi:hypothetical protein
MLKVRVANSKESLVSSSMRDSKEGLKCISSLSLELMVTVEFKAFDNIQCLTDWFKTQVKK